MPFHRHPVLGDYRPVLGDYRPVLGDYRYEGLKARRSTQV